MRMIGRIWVALAIFSAVICVGTIGFRLLEPNMTNLLDSFFFTLITVTTVGYGNVVPETTYGKVLAIIVILTGVGSAMAALQSVFEVVVGRKIKEELNLAEKSTDKKGHIIICGLSKVGVAIVRNLQREDMDFIVVESNVQKVQTFVEAGVSVINGDARMEKVLERAGIKGAKILFATLSDSDNVFVALTAKLINPGIVVVAKVEDPTTNVVKLKKAGADDVVSCHDEGAHKMIGKAVSLV